MNLFISSFFHGVLHKCCVKPQGLQGFQRSDRDVRRVSQLRHFIFSLSFIIPRSVRIKFLHTFFLKFSFNLTSEY